MLYFGVKTISSHLCTCKVWAKFDVWCDAEGKFLGDDEGPRQGPCLVASVLFLLKNSVLLIYQLMIID